MNRLAGVLAVFGVVAGFSAVSRASVAGAPDYADPSSWLCRPGRADVCAERLTSTIVSSADGARTRKTYAPDPAAPIDCFYVYPTVSQEPSGNADMTAAAEEQHAAAEQFARFSAVCRPYAPLYRQTTVAGLRGEAKTDSDLAYADVLAAWRAYLARDNQGRGVVLIGHSQGAYHLGRLIADEIDGRPAGRLLVSAILAGANIQVPDGKDLGGSFQHVPLCHEDGQTGCAIAYSTYLAQDPPGANGRFGGGARPGFSSACVNPAQLLGHATLDAELPTRGDVAAALGTPLVENPGLIAAACTTLAGHTFLAVSVKSQGVGAITLGRALNDLDARTPGWGLHPLDVNLALGDLVAIVGRQGAAWSAAHR
jgi:hypothetical protein